MNISIKELRRLILETMHDENIISIGSHPEYERALPGQEAIQSLEKASRHSADEIESDEVYDREYAYLALVEALTEFARLTADTASILEDIEAMFSDNLGIDIHIDRIS